MHAKPDIAALLGSRICHDLISPIGAISNGVELLMLDGVAKGPEMTLARVLEPFPLQWSLLVGHFR